MKRKFRRATVLSIKSSQGLYSVVMAVFQKLLRKTGRSASRVVSDYLENITLKLLLSPQSLRKSYKV